MNYRSLVLIVLSSFLAFSCQKPKPESPETTKTENQAQADYIKPVGIVKDIPDSALLEIVQRQTFRTFWHHGHPNSGMALERTDTVNSVYYWDYINEAENRPNLSKTKFGPNECAVGGTGFAIMATVVAVERKWISREAAIQRLTKIADFLTAAENFHGVFPHFIDGNTGKTVMFSPSDNGGDIVETSYLIMGFLTAREYFKGNTPEEEYLRNRIEVLWDNVNWNWYTNGGNKYLYWHWSNTQGFDMNFPVYGYDEALITYIVAASSRTHPISKELYENSWVKSASWKNGKQYFGITLPLGNFDMGGPLFFEQYTYLGIDPNKLTDDHGIDYAEQTRAHTLINRAYCIANPKGYKGYGENCWGLTAGDSFKGYVAHCPQDDRGVIQPTAALSSFPFTPEYSMQALKHFYYDRGDKLWTEYGFVDGFSDTHNWVAKSHLAIDQFPIVGMIENHRTGLLWKLFMDCPEIQQGLTKLGFKSPYIK